MSRSLFRTLSSRSRRVLPCRLTRLEERLAPALFTWDGGPGGTGTDFVVATNWVGDVAPGNLDEASIPVGFASSTITIGAGYTLNKLTCASSLAINGGTLTLAAASSVSGSLTINGAGVATGASTFTVSGGLAVAGGSVSGAINVSGGGTFGGSMTVTGAANLNAGNFALENGFTQTGSGSLNLNNCTITVGASATATITNFTHSAGNVTGAGELDVTGIYTLNGGKYDGAGTTTVAGTATATFTGSSGSFVLDGRQINNAGQFNWTGGAITIDNGSVLTNQASGDFVAQAANNMFRNSGVGTALFSNLGTFRRSGPTSTTTISVPFTSTAAIDVQTGTLTFNGAPLSLAGSASVATTLNMNSASATLNNGFTESGVGNFNFNTGTATVTAGANVLFQNLVHSSGKFVGDGSVTVTNLTLNGGTYNGNGTLVIPAGAKANVTGLNGTVFLEGWQVMNASTVSWTGGAITLDNGSVFTNQAGALFDAQTNNNMSRNSGIGTALFSNAGTFRRSVGVGTVFVSAPFASTSVVDVQTGTLTFNGATTDLSATVMVATTMNLSGASTTLNGGLTGSGAGDIKLTVGTATIPSGTVTLQNFTQSGGTITGAGDFSVSNLTQNGGTLKGAGAHIIPSGGKATWSGINGTTALAGRQFKNAGTITWTGGGITIDDGTVFDNQVGGIFDVQLVSNMSRGTDTGTALFSNDGTFRRSVSAGAATITVPFASTGLVDSQTGTLTLNGKSIVLSGSVSVSATINLSGATTTLNNGLTETGAGELKFTAGTATVPTAATISLQTFTQTGGTITGAGTVTVSNLTQTGGTLAGTGSHVIPAGGKGSFTGLSGTVTLAGRQFKNAGTVTWTGGGITMDDGSVFDNQVGGIFDVQTTTTMTRNTDTGTALFSNSGTLRRSVSAGTATITVPFVSTGLIDSQTGTLTLNGKSTDMSGSVSVAATIILSGPATTLNNGLTETGAGDLKLTAGTATVPAAASVSLQDFTQTGGTITGAGTVTVSNLTQTGGMISGAGSHVIPAGGKATITGLNGNFALDGRQFKNAGTVTWTGGSITADNGAMFDNQLGAVFDVQVGSTMSTSSGSALFTNAGQFGRSAGTGTAFISVPFVSTGSIEATAATLTFNGVTTDLSGSVSVTANLNLSGAAATLNNGLTGTGAGDFRLTFGTATVPAAASVNLQTFHQTGGTITGAGTVTITNLTQDGGTMSGTGMHVIPAGGAVTWSGLNAITVISGRQFKNSGTITWTASDILLDSGAVFTNEAAGIFDAKASALLALNGVTTGLFNNVGTFRRSSISGTTSVGTAFLNTGALEAQAGNLAFNGTTFTSSGATTVSLGAVLKANSGNFTQTGGSIVVLGTLDPNFIVDIQGGTLSGTGTIEGDLKNGGTVLPGSSPGKLIINGNYSQTGALSIELNGLTSGSQYDQIVVNGSVTLGGSLTGSVGFTANIGDTFTIIDNDGSDTIGTTFNGLLEGSLIKLSNQYFAVSYKGGTGNDMTLERSNVNTVIATEINGGQAQRSMVTQLLVTFSTNVTLPGTPTDAFDLRRQSDNATVGLNLNIDNSGPGTLVTITFNPGTAVQSGSLADGRYTLTVLAAQVNGGAFDGNADGTNGDDYVLASAPSPAAPTNIFRLFGDINGDGFTDNIDLVQFRQANGSDTSTVNYNAAFDFNDDGFIDNNDLLAFRQRIGVPVP